MNNQDKKIIETAALLSSDDINLDIIQRAARTMLVAFGENVEREG